MKLKNVMEFIVSLLPITPYPIDVYPYPMAACKETIDKYLQLMNQTYHAGEKVLPAIAYATGDAHHWPFLQGGYVPGTPSENMVTAAAFLIMEAERLKLPGQEPFELHLRVPDPAAEDVLPEVLNYFEDFKATYGYDEAMYGRSLTERAKAYLMEAPEYWPGTLNGFEQGDYKENLQKAAAFILLELERLEVTGA